MTLFVAHRTDGLGARLLNIMITMALAEEFDCDFGFTWRHSVLEHHALDRVDSIFTDAFISNHFVTESNLRRRRSTRALIEPHSEIDRKSIEQVLAGGPKSLTVSRFDPPSDLASRFNVGSDNALLRAFSKIGFRENIHQVISLALSLPLPKHPVAIHLRAGDIIFGDYRLDPGFESKVIPLPLAYSIANECISGGRSPIIFGQDLVAANVLARLSGCSTLEDLCDTSQMTAVEQAFFEMALLSRMEVIHAGMSLFVYVPAALGNLTIEDPLQGSFAKSVTSTTMAGLPLFEAEEDISRLQIAYCYRSALFHGHDLPQSTQLALIDGAIKNDRENALYWIMKSQILFAAGRRAEGDRILAEAFNVDSPKVFKERNAYKLLLRRYPDGRLKIETILASLYPFASAAHPYVCLTLSIAAMRLQKYLLAKAFIEEAVRGAPGDPFVNAQSIALRKALLSPKSWFKMLSVRTDGEAVRWLKKSTFHDRKRNI